MLLLPGGMGTASQYEELMAEPDLGGVRLVAVTLPGHGGTPEPDDISVENYARLVAECAADLGCDVVVGFSMGANYALEMAGSGAFSGPLVLLAPSFSRSDEALFMRILDQLGRVLGHLPFAALIKMMGPAMKQVPVTQERREALVAEMGRTARLSFSGAFTSTCSTWTSTARLRSGSANPVCPRGLFTASAAMAVSPTRNVAPSKRVPR